MIYSYIDRIKNLIGQALNKSEAIVDLLFSRGNPNGGIFFYLHSSVEKEHHLVSALAYSLPEPMYCKDATWNLSFVDGICSVNKSAHFNNDTYLFNDFWKIPNCNALQNTTPWCSRKREIEPDPLALLQYYSAKNLLNKSQVESDLSNICSNNTYISCDKLNTTLQNATASVFCNITSFNCAKSPPSSCACTKSMLFGSRTIYSDSQTLFFDDVDRCEEQPNLIRSTLPCTHENISFW